MPRPLLFISGFVLLLVLSYIVTLSPPHQVATPPTAQQSSPSSPPSVPTPSPNANFNPPQPTQISAPPPPPPPSSIADIVSSADLNDPASRARALTRMADLSKTNQSAAQKKARELGLPLRESLPSGAIKEVAALDENGNILYFITHNATAAISTAADVAANQYGLTGSEVNVGVWDSGSARTTHREFAPSRATNADGASSSAHATHVSGTIIASGVSPSAKGMAPSATVESYDWNDDKLEMATRAATAPAQSERILLSNHSYGFITGWLRTGSSNPAWVWYGPTGASSDSRFGQYNSYARDTDAIAHAAPYYLMFRSAGNDRSENPVLGSQIRLSPSSTSSVSYDPSIHPPGDGSYFGGYDLIGFDAVSKNVVTVGSVADAVSGDKRSLPAAQQSSFSAWGPTDDGRIKPDLVGNGQDVWSSLSSSDSAYGTYNGTSMATPNVAGTAALLIEKYEQLFPGQSMRSSTLKGLLIHTADDLGNPGPDYRNGWGLANAAAAVSQISEHASDSSLLRIHEGELTSGTTAQHEVFIKSTSPAKITIVWTDPEGLADNSENSRQPALRNNLDVKVVAPSGEEFFPYVMPFVGTWTASSAALPATTGVNDTDNVEQVLIDTPPSPGIYRIIVSHQGNLQGGLQSYSLLVTGSEPPPPPVSLSSVSPGVIAQSSSATLAIAGENLLQTKNLLLKRGGDAIQALDFAAVTEDLIFATFDLSSAPAGQWDVVASSDSSEDVLSSSVTVVAPALSLGFLDSGTVIADLSSSQSLGALGTWGTYAEEGDYRWTTVEVPDATFEKAVSIFHPSAPATTRLISPRITMPNDSAPLQIHMWHKYSIPSSHSRATLEISFDDGASWVSSEGQGAGLNVSQNGYNTLSLQQPSLPSGWAGESPGYVLTILEVPDTSALTSRTIRLRWTLQSASQSPASEWIVGGVELFSVSPVPSQYPVLPAPLTAPGAASSRTPNGKVYLVTTDVAYLEVPELSSQPSLSVAWSATGPHPVAFEDHPSNPFGAFAHFAEPGEYGITATVFDDELFSTSTVRLSVQSSPAAIEVIPASSQLTWSTSQQFSLRLTDQFGSELSIVPGDVSWTASAGEIDQQGMYTATSVGNNIIVSASLNTGASLFSSSAVISVTPAPVTLTLSNLDQVYDSSPKSVDVTTIPSGVPVRVTYDGSVAPPSEAGSYAIQAVSSSPNYTGSAAAVMNITPAPLVITISNTLRAFDGQPKSVDVNTTPSGVPVSVTYDASPVAPSAPGEYAVAAASADSNYGGSAQAALQIAPPPAGVVFEDWRMINFGADYALSPSSLPDSDPDFDGLQNWVEYHLGTSPVDPNSGLKMRVVSRTNSFADLLISPIPAYGKFQLLQSPSLTTGTGIMTDLPIPAPAESYLWRINVPAKSGFYQVIYSPPTP